MNTPPPTVSRSLPVSLTVTALWVATYLVARLALKELQLDPRLRVAVALLPVVPTALFLGTVIGSVRRLDELQRRVHLEALAIAFPLSILLLWTLGLLQLAVNLPAEDWSYRHVWVFLPLLYFVGLAIAWRRYR
jgi:hypothetical protein